MSNLNKLLIAALLVNLGVSGFLFYHMEHLSYQDIKDAPAIYYTNKENLFRAAAMKGDKEGEEYLINLQRRLQSQNGIILDDNAVIVSSSDFKLNFKEDN